MGFYSAWVPNFKIRNLVTALHWLSFLVSAVMVCQALVFSPANSQLQSGSFCKLQQSSLIAGFLSLKNILICSEEGRLILDHFQWKPKTGILFTPLHTPIPLPHWRISEQAAALLSDKVCILLLLQPWPLSCLVTISAPRKYWKAEPMCFRGKWDCGMGDVFWFNLFLEGEQQGAIDLQTQKKAGSGRTINTGLDYCIPMECLHGNESREKISIKQQMTW